MNYPQIIDMLTGHIKAEHRMGRNYLAGEDGDAILAVAGYNFSLLIKWLGQLLWLIVAALRFSPKSLAT